MREPDHDRQIKDLDGPARIELLESRTGIPVDDSVKVRLSSLLETVESGAGRKAVLDNLPGKVASAIRLAEERSLELAQKAMDASVKRDGTKSHRDINGRTYTVYTLTPTEQHDTEFAVRHTRKYGKSHSDSTVARARAGAEFGGAGTHVSEFSLPEWTFWQKVTYCLSTEVSRQEATSCLVDISNWVADKTAEYERTGKEFAGSRLWLMAARIDRCIRRKYGIAAVSRRNGKPVRQERARKCLTLLDGKPVRRFTFS